MREAKAGPSRTSIEVKYYTYNDGPVPVYHGGELTLKYFTRSGKFDLFSNEESLSCHLEVSENGRRLVSCNTSPEYMYEGRDCNEALAIIEEDIASHWIDTARDEKRRCMNFITRYQPRIEQGNASLRLQKIDKSIEQLNAERERVCAQLHQLTVKEVSK